MWLLLNRLLVDPGWRGQCRLDCEARRERVISLRGLLDDLLLDRLPFLKGLLFLLEQLAQGAAEGLRSAPPRPLVGIHQVGFYTIPYSMLAHLLVPCPRQR